MKRVLLISTNTCRIPYPVLPLGLCLLASVLERTYDVRVHDALGDGDGLERAVRDFRPDYVGLSVRNIDDTVMDGGAYFVDEIRERFALPLRSLTRAPLILGGSGFSIFPRELMATLGADYGVVGEGEETLPALLAALEAGTDPGAVGGVLTRTHASRPPGRKAPLDMASLPVPKIDRCLDFAPYRQRSSYPVQTKRGCAQRCLYCTYPGIEGSSYRLRAPSIIVDEIERAAGALGDVTFEFVDSVFNDPPGHAEAVCREIIRRGLHLRLRTMGINPGGVGNELLGLMLDAGFAQIDATPDSASPAMLGNLGKNFDRDCLERAARLIGEHDLPTMWCFLLGGPGETQETLDETFDFIDRFVKEEDMVHLTEGLRIYPGTPLHGHALRESVLAPGEPLLEPRFYVSPALGREGLLAHVSRAVASRPNCVRASESRPSPAMLQAALVERSERGLAEPMFRTLLRLRRRGLR